jgi:hypothetical protein
LFVDLNSVAPMVMEGAMARQACEPSVVTTMVPPMPIQMPKAKD